MDCPSCGNALDMSMAERYIECEYCQNKVSVLKLAKGFDSVNESSEIATDDRSKISNMMKLANIDLENKNYPAANKVFDNILELHPMAWETLCNKAICEFWSGTDSFQHITNVKSLLDKADAISDGNPTVEATKQDISHNVALIGANKDRTGSEITNSISIFKLSKKLVPTFEIRDKVIEKYALDLKNDVDKRLSRILFRDKKKMDPPRSEIATLWELISLSEKPSKELLTLFIAYTGQKIKIDRKATEFVPKLDKAKTIFNNSYSGNTLPQIQFPFIGTPKIV